MEQQTFTMMTEEDTPEVGPNDIVIHLVNPYKCGMCELEFLEKNVFKDHIFSHLEQIKQERPSSQIVMNIVLPPETPGGVTVTRDILQLGEDGSIKQVLLPANNITLNQVYPLKELEAAGVIKLDPPHPAKPAPVVPPISALAAQSATPQSVSLPNSLGIKETQTNAGGVTFDNIGVLENSQNRGVGTFIKEEDGENGVSEIIENTDGTFSVAFKGPNNEMQHIQIIRPEGMKGEMMLELTNVHNRRRSSSKGVNKSNECDICGKVLSSSTNLLRHKMYHSSERPFVCNTCGKGFKDVSNLKKHTMIHNRIFPCHLCKKSFLRKSLLALHLKRHQARTVFVKCGSAAKKVTLRTYMDDDGTRVEEMSMAALSGQTFEYTKRIVKADPSDVKPAIANNPTPDAAAADAAATDAASVDSAAADADREGDIPSSNDSVEKMNLEPMLDLEPVPKDNQQPGDNASGEVEDDLPEFKVPEGPKEFVKMYQCGHCGKRTVQRGNMMRHLIHHLNEKPFSCDECSKQFVDKGELVKHKKTHSKPYRCNACNGAFAHNVQLIKHQESECLGRTGDLHYTALEDGQTYRCDICQIEMKRLGNMIKHVGTHSSGRYRPIMKRVARPTLKMKKALRKSLKNVPVSGTGGLLAGLYTYNKNKEVFECNHCLKMFKQKVNLLSHIRAHGGECSNVCLDCNRSFPSRASLEKHREVHLKPFKCDRCPAVFSRKLFLDSHTRRHKEKERGEETNDYGVSEDQSQYFCKYCDKKLSQKFRMMNHIRSHLDSRPYECKECNKCFSSQYMLSNHKKMHSKLFTCDQCGEAFPRMFFLHIHRKKHHSRKAEEDQDISSPNTKDRHVKTTYLNPKDPSTSKSFSCSICGCSFSRLVIKLNHEKKCKEEAKILSRVANGNGFQCKLCNRISTLKHNLMVHIRKAHSDLISFDPSGHIHLKDGNEDPAENDFISGDEMEDLTEPMDGVEEQSDEDDDRYTHTPGGYACVTCRTKFLDREALLSHLEIHEEEASKSEDLKPLSAPESPQKEKKEEIQEENATTDGKDSTEIMKEDKTPIRRPGKATGSASVKAKSSVAKDSDSESKKVLSTPSPSASKTDSTEETPSSLSRSSNRPPRTQKIPSRYLE